MAKRWDQFHNHDILPELGDVKIGTWRGNFSAADGFPTNVSNYAADKDLNKTPLTNDFGSLVSDLGISDSSIVLTDVVSHYARWTCKELNDQVVATCGNIDTIYVSDDGATWTRITNGPWSAAVATHGASYPALLRMPVFGDGRVLISVNIEPAGESQYALRFISDPNDKISNSTQWKQCKYCAATSDASPVAGEEYYTKNEDGLLVLFTGDTFEAGVTYYKATFKFPYEADYLNFLYNNGRYVCSRYTPPMFMYSDDGVLWTPAACDAGQYGLGGDILANGNTLLTGGQARLFRSLDNGLTWTDIKTAFNPSGGDGKILGIGRIGDVWVVGSNGKGLRYSEDNGDTWVDTNISGLSCTTLYTHNGLMVILDNDRTSHSASGHYNFWSTDGKTFTECEGLPALEQFKDIRYIRGIWFTQSAKYVYTSKDGKTWSRAFTNPNVADGDSAWYVYPTISYLQKYNRVNILQAGNNSAGGYKCYVVKIDLRRLHHIYKYSGTWADDGINGWTLVSKVFKDGIRVLVTRDGEVYDSGVDLSELYPFRVEDESSGGGGGGSTTEGTGGVIDGTLWFTPEPFTKTFTSGVVQDLYLVQHDCGLYIKIHDAPVAGSVQLLIDGKPIFSYADVAGNQIGTGSVIPVKAGTQISAIVTEPSAVTHTFTAYEFVLRSIAPQAAFPDWSESKRSVNLLSTLEGGESYTAPKSGYIAANIKVVAGITHIKVNGITVGSWYPLVSTGTSDFSTQVIPVAMGDVVTMALVDSSDPSDDSSVYFYPAKAVQI